MPRGIFERTPEIRAKIAASLRGRKRPDVSERHRVPVGSKHLSNGYIEVKVFDGDRRSGWELEHRYLMSQHLGRPLLSTEVVHHINEVKTDNRLENLQVMTKEDHDAHHNELKARTSYQVGCEIS